jgi:hypothetical protein
MTARAPCQKRRIPILSGEIELVWIEFEWVWIEPLIQMDVSEVIRHECPFIDDLSTDSKVIGKVAAKQSGVAHNAECLANDTFYHRHLVFPCGYWDRGEALVNWLGGCCVGIGSDEIPDFGGSSFFPRIGDAEVN